MSKRTTNLIGLVITILAGTYFYMMYCSECRQSNGFAFQEVERLEENQLTEGENIANITFYYHDLNKPNEEYFMGNSLQSLHKEIAPIYFDLQN